MSALAQWFQHPGWLLLMLPALAFVVADAIRRWGTTGALWRAVGGTVRFVAIAGIVVALADPRWHEREDVAHVVFVVDRSASIPDAALDDALARADALARNLPEGTRTAPGDSRPYHPGVAALYSRFPDVPVVPVALNSGLLWGRRAFRKDPGTVTLRILPPVERGLDRRAFLNTLHMRIEEAVAALPPPGRE